MKDTDAAWDALRGTNFLQKMASIGIERGSIIDIRDLDGIGRDYGIGIYLFFEKDLAVTRTLAEVLEEFRDVPEYERPFVTVTGFLRFTRENDPSFAQTLEGFPLMIEIAATGEIRDPVTGRTLPFITGLMPFLDEFDVDVDPVARQPEQKR